ncbi:MAG: phosphoribosylglycinamide formyltransferase [Deltaproteobacteria bacterium]|nr:phosphoribosylglycinamide formyltransferase [Deltaproteobacteria bacterium]
MVDLAVLVSGGGTNLQSIIDSIESGRLHARIKVVLSDNPEAYALQRAKRHGIPFEAVTKDAFPGKAAFNAEIVRVLKSYGVELVALAGYMRIVSKAVLDAFPMRVINIHPSLLPSFPGLAVQKKALEHGVKFSGCTVHFVDEGVDSGPIIIQAAVPVLDGDTVETLSQRILAEEHRIYPQAIQLFSEGRLAVRGRRVYIKDSAPSGPAVENPKATVFDDK